MGDNKSSIKNKIFHNNTIMLIKTEFRQENITIILSSLKGFTPMNGRP